MCVLRRAWEASHGGPRTRTPQSAAPPQPPPRVAHRCPVPNTPVHGTCTASQPTATPTSSHPWRTDASLSSHDRRQHAIQGHSAALRRTLLIVVRTPPQPHWTRSARHREKSSSLARPRGAERECSHARPPLWRWLASPRLSTPSVPRTPRCVSAHPSSSFPSPTRVRPTCAPSPTHHAHAYAHACAPPPPAHTPVDTRPAPPIMTGGVYVCPPSPARSPLNRLPLIPAAQRAVDKHKRGARRTARSMRPRPCRVRPAPPTSRGPRSSPSSPRTARPPRAAAPRAAGTSPERL